MNDLFLKINKDGNGARLIAGSRLVVRFKWREGLRCFEMIPANKRWENLIYYHQTFRYYLDHVLEILEKYREGALKLATQKKELEDSVSGFLSVD